jgi:hypothetical protein
MAKINNLGILVPNWILITNLSKKFNLLLTAPENGC